MAGKPGRSGGARPGAGRPPKEPEKLELSESFDDPIAFLKAVMNDDAADAKLRVDAAKAVLPYMHQRMGETGKKEAKQEAAHKVAARFATAVPPKLVASGGVKV